MAIPLSKRSQIAAALLARLAGITEIKYSAFDKVRLLASDFQEFELPAVQIIDLGEVNLHETLRGRKTWNLAIEVVMGPKVNEGVDQKALWDLMEYIETTIFPKPNLGLTFVVHMKLLGSATDLHLLEPLYTGRLDITVDYYQPLTGDC